MWLWQSPRSGRAQVGGGVGERRALGGLQTAQVHRLLAGERLGDALRRHVADPAQAP